MAVSAIGGQVQRISEVQPLRVQSQGIGDELPFLDANVGQSKHMFDDPDEIIGREAIKGAQDPFKLKNHGQWYEHMGDSTKRRWAIGRCLAASGSAGSAT